VRPERERERERERDFFPKRRKSLQISIFLRELQGKF
jgi:hypothetical protein